MKKQTTYLSYLVRLWRVSDDEDCQPVIEQAAWRASVENPHTRERKRFASLEALFDFLREQMGILPDTDENQIYSVSGEHNESKNGDNPSG